MLLIPEVSDKECIGKKCVKSGDRVLLSSGLEMLICRFVHWNHCVSVPGELVHSTQIQAKEDGLRRDG